MACVSDDLVLAVCGGEGSRQTEFPAGMILLVGGFYVGCLSTGNVVIKPRAGGVAWVEPMEAFLKQVSVRGKMVDRT